MRAARGNLGILFIAGFGPIVRDHGVRSSAVSVPPEGVSSEGESVSVGKAFRWASLETIRQRLALLGKRQRYRIEAVTLARGRRAVWEHVSQVTSTTCAHLFYPHHSVAGVAHAANVRLIVRPEEARPSC